MKKVLMATLAAVATLAGGAAHADKVYWSVGVNAPNVGTVITNAPRVYLPPPPAVYVPPPVVYQPPPPAVVYQPQPYYTPAPPVVYRRVVPVYEEPRWRHHHHHHRDWDDRGWDDRGGYRY